MGPTKAKRFAFVGYLASAEKPSALLPLLRMSVLTLPRRACRRMESVCDVLVGGWPRGESERRCCLTVSVQAQRQSHGHGQRLAGHAGC